MIYKKAKDSLKPKKPPQGEKSAKAGKKMTVQLVDFKKLIQEKKNCERKSIDSSMLSLLPQSIVKASIDSKSNKSGQPQTLLKKKKKKKSEAKDLSTPSALLAVSPLLPTSRNGVGRISMDVTKASEAPKSSSSIKKLVAMKALKSKRKNHDSSGAKNDSSTPSGIANDP